jgi:hypothetical protein
MTAAGAERATARSVTAVVIVCNDWFGFVFILGRLGVWRALGQPNEKTYN